MPFPPVGRRAKRDNSEVPRALPVGIYKFCKGYIIEFDGGVTPETAKKAVQAGANLLVAGAYIFNSADIKQAIEILRDLTP